MKILLIVIYLILTSSGLIFMKLGGNSGSLAVQDKTNLLFSINLVSLIGFICYICSFLLFTKIVTKYDLSYIMPLCTGIVQVIALVAAKFIFKETMSTQGVVGAIIVIIGIIIMNIPKSAN